MEFARRLVWYLFGVLVGAVFVYLWFGSRTDISCNYFPDARVKGDILKKEMNYQKATIKMLVDVGLDTTDVHELLKNGDVVFRKSNTKLDSCKTYYIENSVMSAVFENCNSIVNILEVSKVEKEK